MFFREEGHLNTKSSRYRGPELWSSMLKYKSSLWEKQRVKGGGESEGITKNN